MVSINRHLAQSIADKWSYPVEATAILTQLPPEATEARAFLVSKWRDENGNGKVDSSELQGTSRAVVNEISEASSLARAAQIQTNLGRAEVAAGVTAALAGALYVVGVYFVVTSIVSF